MAGIDQSLRSLQPMPFWKMNGSGNDFVVVDNREGILPESLKSAWTRRVCRPRLSLGADGVVLIESLPNGFEGEARADFRWRYFNADGSEGEMCGNGAMCGARFAVERQIAPNPCAFETPSGIVQAMVRDGECGPEVWLAIPDTGPVEPEVQIEQNREQLTLHTIDVGVPHVVLLVEDADRWPNDGCFEEKGRAIRRHPRFSPAGTNVNVISIRDDGSIRMRTYERGVEAETLACGTGAVASSVAGTVLGLVKPPVTVRTSSGQPLHVAFTMRDRRATGVRLGGTAMVVAEGRVLPDAFESTTGDETTDE